MDGNKANIAIIVAAGKGSRAGGDIPKQYRQIAGKAMLRHSYDRFAAHADIDAIYVVIAAGQNEMAAQALMGVANPKIIIGGETRRESVSNALEDISRSGGAKNVLIHDAARPFLANIVIDNLLSALRGKNGAVPALPIVDSLARGADIMGPTVERDGLRRIQTPQAFHFGAILSAHRSWDSSMEASDDARMAMAAGHDVALVMGDEALAKYTFAHDFAKISQQEGHMPMMRTGTGFDVHRLKAGEELWLCGVKIDHDFGLSGHSDADVALHALTDAILGAAALGDIGEHFPPSDPQWRGASSDQFLAHAVKLARESGYAIGNVDVTLICEAPKISPHKSAMRAKLADILKIDVGHVSVKATTTEGLGFTGRKEGIAAQALASLILAGDN